MQSYMVDKNCVLTDVSLSQHVHISNIKIVIQSFSYVQYEFWDLVTWVMLSG